MSDDKSVFTFMRMRMLMFDTVSKQNRLRSLGCYTHKLFAARLKAVGYGCIKKLKMFRPYMWQ